MNAENMPEMLLRELVIRFSGGRNPDSAPPFHASLQILCGRQVFPQEQHDPVPAGLRRRPPQRQRGEAAAVRGTAGLVLNTTPQRLQTRAR